MIVNVPINRDNQLFQASVVPARFLARERYITLKDRGLVLFEFTPKEVSQSDPARKLLVQNEKKVATIFSDDFYNLLNFKDELTISRRTKAQTYEIALTKTQEGVHMKLEITEPTQTMREITLKMGEFFMVQRFLDVILTQYSLPYVMGWYAIGNTQLAEQNLSEHVDPKNDPFDKI